MDGDDDDDPDDDEDDEDDDDKLLLMRIELETALSGLPDSLSTMRYTTKGNLAHGTPRDTPALEESYLLDMRPPTPILAAGPSSPGIGSLKSSS